LLSMAFSFFNIFSSCLLWKILKLFEA
jgi:hypothetical protein